MHLRPYKLIISYDGTAYLGWQKTKMGPSIQESLQKAVQQISQEEIVPEGASRTDRGVHAIGQVALLPLKKKWEPRALQRALNAALPRDIRIHAIEISEPDFHPTLQAVEKEYHYSLCLSPVQDPIHRLYSWAFPYPLDIEKMNRAARDFLGERDFSSFANGENEKESNPVCSLNRITISPVAANRLQIAIAGNRFLYKMARNIVGTLIYVGSGKLPEDSIEKILASKDRKQAGITAPAHGLALYKVIYWGVPKR